MTRIAGLVLVLVWVGVLLSGCIAGGSARRTTCPEDFALSLYTPSPTPAWFVLDADGTLRAATGPRLPQSPVPPGVRTLTTRQVQGVWRVARTVKPKAPQGDSGAPAEFWMAAYGRKSERLLPADDAALGTLAGMLRDLAWASP